MDRLRRLGERWRPVGVVLAVNDRFSEVNGGFVAAAITLSLFLSLFPLILVGVAVLGFFAAGDADLPGEIIEFLGLSGAAAKTMRETIAVAEESRRVATFAGLAGLLWAGLGLVNAMEYGYNAAWQVKGRGIKDKAVALLWIVSAGLIFLGSLGLGWLLHFVPAWVGPVNVLAAVVVNVGLFWWSSHLLGNRDVGWRPLLPGALLAGIGLELLKLVGSFYLPHVVKASALYGSLGTAIALLAWLFFLGRLLVYSSVLDVVLHERRRGTVTVEVEAPNIPGEVPSGADRGGAVRDRAKESTGAPADGPADAPGPAAKEPARS